MRRVAVTGVGAVSAAGLDLPSTWEAVRDGRDVLARASAGRDDQTAGLLVAEVKGFDAAAHFDRRQLASLDPVSQYAVVAAREAIARAGMDLQPISPDRTRCIIGSGTGGERTHDDSSRQVYEHGASRLHPMTVPKIMMSAVASQVALDLQIRGGVYAVSSACASAAHAIGQAFADVRSGVADVAVAGGSEACLSYGCLRGWQALHVLSDDRCRPFSLGRRGLVLGEGAAMFVLEEWEGASRRGADILAEAIGFGMSSDAGSITAPDPDGMGRALRNALADARCSAGDVDHVNAHGTGTQANDRAECEALAAVFGPRLSDMPVTATKSVVGHALGASGAIELAMAVMTLRQDVVPPTANHVKADADCPIDCVPNAARDFRARTVVSSSFAFGGLNAAIAIRRV